MKKILTLILVEVGLLYAGNCKEAVVYNLDLYGDNYLSVRSFPKRVAGDSNELDRLISGKKVFLCDRRNTGSYYDWYRIYYGPGCKHPPRDRRCRSGWSYGKYLKIIQNSRTRERTSNEELPPVCRNPNSINAMFGLGECSSRSRRHREDNRRLREGYGHRFNGSVDIMR